MMKDDCSIQDNDIIAFLRLKCNDWTWWMIAFQCEIMEIEVKKHILRGSIAEVQTKQQQETLFWLKKAGKQWDIDFETFQTLK